MDLLSFVHMMPKGSFNKYRIKMSDYFKITKFYYYTEKCDTENYSTELFVKDYYGHGNLP
jgi:hypothetical protein